MSKRFDKRLNKLERRMKNLETAVLRIIKIVDTQPPVTITEEPEPEPEPGGLAPVLPGAEDGHWKGRKRANPRHTRKASGGRA